MMGVDCGFGIPLVATKISSFIPWIDSVMYPKAKKIIENVEIKSKLNGIVRSINFEEDLFSISLLNILQNASANTVDINIHPIEAW
jgi:hypothetical protein